MEIHQRRASAQPSATSSSSSSYDRGENCTAAVDKHPQPLRRLRGGAIARPPPSSATTIDAIIVRVVQCLILVAAAWFAYLAVTINSDPPSSGTTTGAGGEGGGGGIRAGAAVVDARSLSAAREGVLKLREEFYERYGGKEASLAMLKRGLRTFEEKEGSDGGGGANRTADRFLRAIVRHERESGSSSASEHPRFVMAFGGYSVTVGRGNYLSQSFPFVLERIMAPLLAQPPLGIELVVRNSAIGGIPSFPYGWCLPNFLGRDADAVSWDYGMNEGNGASGLESYIRHSLMLHRDPRRDGSDPLFVLVDLKSRDRLNLLQRYVDLGYLSDPIAVGNRDAIDKSLLALPEEERPSGLRKWDEWGAPPGSPGQSPWHPKKMEHELMGWMIAMRLVDAVDAALDAMERDPDWRARFRTDGNAGAAGGDVILPPPATDVSKTGAASLLHGAPSEGGSGDWHMHPVSCRTSFLPNILGKLGSIVVSGVTEDADDMLQPRDDGLFEKGWVMDVGKLERETKVKVEKKGGLGYIDMKTALYGVPSSGALRLRLPYEGRKSADAVAPASDYFAAVVICEVNEKRGDKECDYTKDLSFRVGGVKASAEDVSRIKGAASYLKKEICVRVGVPEAARVSETTAAAESDGGGGTVGLDVEVTVVGKQVSRDNGACSISHVIWENR